MSNDFLSYIFFEEDILNTTKLTDISSLAQKLSKHYTDYEILIVLNRQSLTQKVINDFVAATQHVRVINLAYAISRSDAISVGINLVIGDYIVIADLKNDSIDLILDASRHVIKSNQLIVGINERSSESFLYKISKGIFRLISKRINYKVPSNMTGLLCIPRGLINTLCEGVVSDLEIVHKIFLVSSEYGVIKYHSSGLPKQTFSSGFAKLFNFLIFNSLTPLRVMTLMGVTGSFISLMISVYTVCSYFIMDNTVPGWTSLQLSISVLFSILFIVLAFLNEYIGRLLKDQKKINNFKVTGEISSNIIAEDIRLNIKQND